MTILFTMGKPLKDMTGMKFGMLTVVRRSDKNKGTGAAWHCVCDCENHTEVDVSGNQLRSGRTKSCGCIRNRPSKFINNISGQYFNGILVLGRDVTVGGSTRWECLCHCGNKFSARQWKLRNLKVTSCGCLTSQIISKANSANLIGKKFGKLTVVKRLGSNKWRKFIWECLCDCGNTTSVPTDALVWGGIKSCGCLYYDVMVTHGMTHTKEYRRFMVNRRKELKELYDSTWTREMEVSLRCFFKEYVVCGSKERPTTGHLRALSKGNGLTPGNAIVLCINCNSKQWTYPPENLPRSLPIDAGSKMIIAAQQFKEHWESTHPTVTVNS